VATRADTDVDLVGAVVVHLGMGHVTCHLSMSLDGYIAGPDQSRDDPVGVGGMQLLQWQLSPDEADVAARGELLGPIGAVVMGRNMFGPLRGPWSEDWRGWWGDDPPYHAPVFVLTRYAHDPIEMSGATTFHFVTGGFDVALDQARTAAGDGDIRIAGGASTVRQALDAGAIDDLWLVIVPVALGRGETVFDGPKAAGLAQLEVTHSTTYTHIRYRVG
jgi:dihydrofolate reductase